MNKEYYSKCLKYDVGEYVLYNGKKHKIVHIHNDGLMNLEYGWFFIHNVHPNMFYKIN